MLSSFSQGYRTYMYFSRYSELCTITIPSKGECSHSTPHTPSIPTTYWESIYLCKGKTMRPSLPALKGLNQLPAILAPSWFQTFVGSRELNAESSISHSVNPSWLHLSLGRGELNAVLDYTIRFHKETIFVSSATQLTCLDLQPRWPLAV